MEVKLTCREENRSLVLELLQANGIRVCESVDIEIIEAGMQTEARCGVQIVFEMQSLPRFVREMAGIGQSDATDGIILGKRNEAYRPIPIPDIVYIRALGNDTYVYERTGLEYAIRYKLYQLEQGVLPVCFVRINKSEIVNISHIEQIVPMFKGKLTLHMEGVKMSLDISRSYTKLFKERLGL